MKEMDIMDAIRARRSVRTFDGAELSSRDCATLKEALERASSPFKGRIFTSIYSPPGGEDVKVPSTYGVIKGARSFILVAIDTATEADSALNAGFACEAAVLKAEAMGLGTCWLGGTFSRKDFAPAADIPEGFMLIAVIPVGRPADKTRFLEKMMRKVAGSDSRKPFAELFFEGKWGNPLSEESEWADALKAVRLAPSSTNSQPWRTVVDGRKVHFYYKPGIYAYLDMGIALCHFSLTAGKPYQWRTDSTNAPQSPKPFIYLGTASF